MLRCPKTYGFERHVKTIAREGYENSVNQYRREGTAGLVQGMSTFIT